MYDSNTSNEETIEESIGNDKHQLHCIGFGADTAICQECSAKLRKGESVTVYAVRPASEPGFEVGFVLCEEHENEFSVVWSRGVRELIVRGRVGRVLDAGKKASWKVLLDPEIALVSPSEAMEAYSVEELQEIRGPSTAEIEAAVAGKEDGSDVNEAVTEINQLQEPADDIRPAAEAFSEEDQRER
ncbi:hypothetical protein [Halorubrum vacuolatum]|uniref:DUF8112 domain-containing protein n=1 Tax=Halorubrum vacuolatum TaxID=63740 RepID=A0A238XC92_HALVU|nr:hypothetical protein [Halorubrum vacuolatum]SNR56656.1 hypothetical protein SAMN06264855_11611 [Halorubrum vacuolatum]